MKTLATLTIASLFSLTASASNLSNTDYESYAQSSVWPSNTTSVSNVTVEDLSTLDYEAFAESGIFPSSSHSSSSTAIASIGDIQSAIETSPTASGSSNVQVRDLAGEDIHAQ